MSRKIDSKLVSNIVVKYIGEFGSRCDVTKQLFFNREAFMRAE